jgi:hypothetical protein
MFGFQKSSATAPVWELSWADDLEALREELRRLSRQIEEAEH